MEGQEQRKSGRRRGEVSRSERRTKANFIATESSMRALHEHAAGSLTSTTLATASSHLDGADGGCFRQPLLGHRVQHVNAKDMYVGRNSSMLNVHIQHAHLDCRGKEEHVAHETRVRNFEPNKLQSCAGRRFWREMFPVLCGALGCSDVFSKRAGRDVTYA